MVQTMLRRLAVLIAATFIAQTATAIDAPDCGEYLIVDEPEVIIFGLYRWPGGKPGDFSIATTLTATEGLIVQLECRAGETWYSGDRCGKLVTVEVKSAATGKRLAARFETDSPLPTRLCVQLRK